ncbi:MAG TPA: M36 family metallopeptidase, partial [Polyangiales bacterium]
VEGDPLRAEGQDSADDGEQDNANMTTMSDGRSPRMQMYVWSGLPNRSIVTAPALSFADGFGAALFGPQTFDVSGHALVLSNDGSTALPADTTGTGTTSDACQVPTNVKGQIAVIDRGVCAFVDKAKNAQMAGAIALLVFDNAPGHTPPSPGVDDTSITIPLLSLSYEDGQTLKSVLASGSVSATTFTRGVETLRDGTIDNSVIAHEWGHYLHHRLVQCGSLQCDGMSEGWADFNALLMVIRDGDTFPGKVYPLAQYASGGLSANATYFGIRRAPYSVELDKNPFTFQDVRQMATLPTTAPLSPADPDPSEAHNVGEIWAETLFEAYADLLTTGYAAGRSFDDTKRRMADYVVAGMKAAPTEPSFVEQRDAILASVYAMSANDPSRLDDFSALARGFAKRGLGVGAIAPPTASTTLDEAFENFDFKGALVVSAAGLDDSVSSCDHDGKLDAGESGKLTFTVTNSGWLSLTGTSVHVQSDAALTFDGGGTLQVGTLQPFGSATLTIGVKAAAGVRKASVVKLTVTAADPEAYAPSVSSAFELLYDYDDVAASAAFDDVESDHTAWVVSPDTLASVWSREGDALGHVWHADDVGVQADESLVSPSLVVSAVS